MTIFWGGGAGGDDLHDVCVLYVLHSCTWTSISLFISLPQLYRETTEHCSNSCSTIPPLSLSLSLTHTCTYISALKKARDMYKLTSIQELTHHT